jgi:hypothetical protein
VAEDPPAKELDGVREEYFGRHYLAGDEWNLHLFEPHIRGKGGGYVGVGSDQSYLLIAWQRPAFAWQIDYDELVVLLHQAYRVFFRESSTRGAFIELWSPKGSVRALELIDQHLAGHPKQRLIRRVYREQRANIEIRLRRQAKIYAKAKVAWFLSDDEQYAFIRQMIAAERIRPMCGNLLEKKTLVGIGAAARQTGLTIRVFYPSNAEEYWHYPQQFRDNIAGLPFDADSLVIRTLSTWSINQDYRYYVQAGSLFQDWLRRPWVNRVYLMTPRRKLKGPEDIQFAVLTGDPAAAEAKRAARQPKRPGRANRGP